METDAEHEAEAAHLRSALSKVQLVAEMRENQASFNKLRTALDSLAETQAVLLGALAREGPNNGTPPYGLSKGQLESTLLEVDNEMLLLRCYLEECESTAMDAEFAAALEEAEVDWPSIAVDTHPAARWGKEPPIERCTDMLWTLANWDCEGWCVTPDMKGCQSALGLSIANGLDELKEGFAEQPKWRLEIAILLYSVSSKAHFISWLLVWLRRTANRKLYVLLWATCRSCAALKRMNKTTRKLGLFLDERETLQLRIKAIEDKCATQQIPWHDERELVRQLGTGELVSLASL